jgi:hypothetical protein
MPDKKDAFEDISKDDYRNLPQYKRFHKREKEPKTTASGKNYSLLEHKSEEQLIIENTVRKQKLIRAGLVFLLGLVMFLTGEKVAQIYDFSTTIGKIAEAVSLVSNAFMLFGVLLFSLTVFGPVRSKDVEKYQDKIKKALKEQQKRNQIHGHKKRKGGKR